GRIDQGVAIGVEFAHKTSAGPQPGRLIGALGRDDGKGPRARLADHDGVSEIVYANADAALIVGGVRRISAAQKRRINQVAVRVELADEHIARSEKGWLERIEDWEIA